DAHDFFLLVAHRAGHVHHVDDDGVRDGLVIFFPRAVAPVFVLRHDQRALGLVHAARDRAAQRFFVRALEMAERLRADAPDAGVAILRRDDPALAFVFDFRKLELFAQDVGELVERDVDFEHVVARVFAGLAGAVFAFALFAADGIAHVALALTHAAALLVAE